MGGPTPPAVPLDAWTAYTPTVSVSSPGATPPAFGGVSGRYVQIGKTVLFAVVVVMTSTGTGSGAILVGLPLPVRGSATFSANENGALYKLLRAIADNTGSTVYVAQADGSYAGANNGRIIITGSYETT